MELEPIEPQTAVELYLADRETEVSRATLNAHHSLLRFFDEWCGSQGIQNLNELTGRQLHQYRIWRRQDGDLAPPSEKSQMDMLRVFVRWVGTIDGVDTELHHKVRSPDFKKGAHAKTDTLDAETAEPLLAYLEKFEYASRDHVVVAFQWARMRAGQAYAEMDAVFEAGNHMVKSARSRDRSAGSRPSAGIVRRSANHERVSKKPLMR